MLFGKLFLSAVFICAVHICPIIDASSLTSQIDLPVRTALKLDVTQTNGLIINFVFPIKEEVVADETLEIELVSSSRRLKYRISQISSLSFRIELDVNFPLYQREVIKLTISDPDTFFDLETHPEERPVTEYFAKLYPYRYIDDVSFSTAKLLATFTEFASWAAISIIFLCDLRLGMGLQGMWIFVRELQMVYFLGAVNLYWPSNLKYFSMAYLHSY